MRHLSFETQIVICIRKKYHEEFLQTVKKSLYPKLSEILETLIITCVYHFSFQTGYMLRMTVKKGSWKPT